MPAYPYCAGPDVQGLTCDRANLELLARLNEDKDKDSVYREFLYRCRACGGLYKYVYAERYATRNMDSDEGWETLADEYVKVDYPRLREDSPLSVEEALRLGYLGDDRPLTGGRCDLPRELNGLTCRFSQLAGVARLDEVTWIRRCSKCGQLYKHVAGHRHHFYKPGEEAGGTIPFTLEEARGYGCQDPDCT